MEKTAILQASQLAPAARAWIASVLHVELNDEDECELTIRKAVSVPTADQRAAAQDNLRQLLRRTDGAAQPVSDEELNAALEEALHAERRPDE